VAFAGSVSFTETANCQVVGLRSSGDEDNFIRLGADQTRHLTSRAVNGSSHFLAEKMDAGRIAKRSCEVRQHRCNHALIDSPFAPLRGWFPIECFHFPLRSEAQCAHKAMLQGEAFSKHIARPPTAYHADMFSALRSGRIGEYYEALVVSDEELQRGRAQGRLVVDTRLRDALREFRDESGAVAPRGSGSGLRFPLPTLVEDAEYAVEAATLGEADVVRLQRRLDELEQRLQTVEQRLPRRLVRKLTRSTQRVLGGRFTSG